jgi:hypothetical protein
LSNQNGEYKMAFVIPNKKPAAPTIAPAIAVTQPTEQAVAIQQEQPVTPVTTTSQAVANNTNSASPANHLDLAIEQQLIALISKIESAIPDVRHEMITIHKALAKDPAQVTILSTDQRAAIFAGYSKLAGIELVAKAAAKKGSKTPISIDMFE